MVHGGCSSVGCYAITDEGVDEVHAVVEAALKNGQEAVDVANFLSRMTAGSQTQGHDLFEADCIPPRLGASRGEYHRHDAEDAQCAAIAAWS